MKKTKDEIEKFQKARDEWKKKELETVELENKYCSLLLSDYCLFEFYFKDRH